MNKLKDFYVSIVDIVQEWSRSTSVIILGILAFITFYTFAVFVKKNKGDPGKIKGLGTFFLLIILIALIVFYTSCIYY